MDATTPLLKILIEEITITYLIRIIDNCILSLISLKKYI